MTSQLNFEDTELSVAMASPLDRVLAEHLNKGRLQEDLAFAYWRPSVGARRMTAVISEVVLPKEGERILQGNVAFTSEYLRRVLAERPDGAGVALLHSHLGPGWQGMSPDDIVAERDRIAGPAWGQSGLPTLGLTWATDGHWSARLWLRAAPRTFVRREVRSVRVSGRSLRSSYHRDEMAASPTPSQVRTVSVWGEAAQAQLVRARVGVVGLGSVGSIVAEGLARMGLAHITLIDFDILEERNRDRTAGATRADVAAHLSKVQVAARNVTNSATAPELDLRVVPFSLLEPEGLAAALDCDVIICCVDRPWPRFVLNAIAYAQLIPVVDGGIAAYVKPDGTPLHVSWRIHTISPEYACMVCQDALRRSDVALDREGRLDDPDYIRGLSETDRARFSGRNVYPFSLSVAAHELLQLVGLLTGYERIGGTGPQTYQGYPGEMTVSKQRCEPDCEFAALTGTAADPAQNIAQPNPG
jgi:tRNA A37 threonylcarbamoyladenosine dehydratase